MSESMALVSAVIYPPKDVREVIDKVAKFAARLGEEFEAKVQRESDDKDKFAFLLPHDIYHAYYTAKRGEFAGGDRLPEPQPEQIHHRPSATKRSAAVEASEEKRSELVGHVVPLVAERELRRRKGDVPAAERLRRYRHILDAVPADTPAFDVQCLKLAARFVAKNGGEVEQGLLAREGRNPSFAFLRPSHSLHGTFRQLVDAYERALLPHDVELQVELAELMNPRLQLAQALDRWAYEANEEEKRAKEQAARDETAELNAAVDWHDFVVVGELTFDDDNVDDLPPTVTVEEVRALARLEATAEGTKRSADAAAGGAAGAGAADDDGDMDMDASDDDSGMDMDASDDGAAAAAAASATADIDPSLIRDEPFVRTSSTMGGAKRTQVCPRCGQDIPVDEMAEHMRIELLDPKYREQRKRNEEKTKERSFADASEVAANIKRMARKRADIMGAASGASDASQRGGSSAHKHGSALEKQLQSIAQETQLSAAEQAAISGRAAGDSGAPSGTEQAVAEASGAAAGASAAGGSSSAAAPPPPPGFPAGMPLPPPGWMPGMPLPPLPLPQGGAAPPPGLPAGLPMPPPGWKPGMPIPMPPTAGGETVSGQKRSEASGDAAADGDAASDAKRARTDDAGAGDAAGAAAATAAQAPPPPADTDEAWVAKVPHTHVKVTVPDDDSKPQWKLNGQTLEHEFAIESDIKQVKEWLAEHLGGMPNNKQKLLWRRHGQQVLKDNESLLKLRFEASEEIDLHLKTRGGKKKA